MEAADRRGVVLAEGLFAGDLSAADCRERLGRVGRQKPREAGDPRNFPRVG